MPSEGETTSDFEFSLGMPFSEASHIAQVALDPDLAETEYPPTLSASDISAQMNVRSDVRTGTADEDQVRRNHIYNRLISWAAEGFFDIVPLPGSQDSAKIGFRMTGSGMKTAVDNLRRQGKATNSLVRRVEKKPAYRLMVQFIR